MGPPFIIAELDEHMPVVELFNNGADLPPPQALIWLGSQQRYRIEKSPQ